MSRNRASKLLRDPYSILRRPVMTEKSHDMASAGGEDNLQLRRYTLEVHLKANKHQIKKAIEAAFGVKVAAISTLIVKPRRKVFRGGQAGGIGFSRQRKKAIVRLTKDSKQIDLI